MDNFARKAAMAAGDAAAWTSAGAAPVAWLVRPKIDEIASADVRDA